MTSETIDFIDAALNGRLDEVRICLEEKNVQVDTQNASGDTALILAAKQGHIDTCNFLISKGCNVNIQNKNNSSAFILAAEKGHLAICKSLIIAGCKLDIQDNDGYSALIWAARWGHKEVVELIISTGCNIDLQTKNDGYTALIFAAQNGHEQIGHHSLPTHSHTYRLARSLAYLLTCLLNHFILRYVTYFKRMQHRLSEYLWCYSVDSCGFKRSQDHMRITYPGFM